MEYNIRIIENNIERVTSCGSDKTLLEVLRNENYPVHAPCGGNGTCKQCTVTVTGTCRDFNGNTVELQSESVLSCRYYPASDLTVAVKTATGSKILTDSIDICGGGNGLGLAIDIGTTTVAAYIYDLETGKCIAGSGEMNAQRPYGSDVISRIQYCSEPDGLNRLCTTIRTQILSMAKKMCSDLSRITYISIAANTVMEHIFAGLSPESIGVAPFTPLSLFGEELPASKFFDAFSPDCRLYLCPAIAGYVGGDITAGLLSTDCYLKEHSVLFIDIGTNGEMGIGNKDGFICCATAAGPAFEGGEIECGSSAQDGAINTVAKDLSFTTLGNCEPASICGSGLIDAIAALLINEEMDETGILEDDPYYFTDKVYLSGQDIRQVQMAKGAVRAGIETLLQKHDITYDDVSEVLIAGGFGAYMNKVSACTIGMLPPALVGKIKHVGNSAGKGAALALTPAGRETLAKITSICDYEELSSSAAFNDNYIEAMLFEEWEEMV